MLGLRRGTCRAQGAPDVHAFTYFPDRFTRDFQQVGAWVMPQELLTPARTGNMSISGGSWGPDGNLYLTGHDNSEIHQVAFPAIGSELVLVGTYPLARTSTPSSIADVSIRGQGIAWDRTTCADLYGIIRATSAERKAGITHKVTVMRASWN